MGLFLSYLYDLNIFLFLKVFSKSVIFLTLYNYKIQKQYKYPKIVKIIENYMLIKQCVFEINLHQRYTESLKSK